MVGLERKKESLRDAEIARQTQIGIRRNGALAQDDFVDPAGRHGDGARERRLAQRCRPQELLHENLARVRVQATFSDRSHFDG